MVDLNVDQGLANHRLQVITPGYGRYHPLYRHIMPGHLPPDVHLFAKISAVRGDVDYIRRPAMPHLVNGVETFVDQRLTQPADGHRQLRTAWG